MRRILTHRNHDLRWESGSDSKNEWVYATLESDGHRARLVEWLRSKNVPSDSDAFLFMVPSNSLVTITWGELLDAPERFIGQGDFELISKDLIWRLDHKQGCVARFGRWTVPSRTAT